MTKDEISLSAAIEIMAEMDHQHVGGKCQLTAAVQCIVNTALEREREACAKVCDANAEHWREMYSTANQGATELVLRGHSAREDSAADCATNIRERL